MPNWCENTVTFRHADPAQIKKVVAGYNAGKLMGKFFPCPRALTSTTSGFLGETLEQIKLEEKQARNLKKYGYENWYDWQVAEWGTKWDVGAPEGHKEKIKAGATEVKLRFDSAWSPPIQFYEKMHYDRNFDVEAMFFEPGVGFIGSWKNGTDDTHMLEEFSGATRAETLTNMTAKLPAELLETFGVVDFLGGDEPEE